MSGVIVSAVSSVLRLRSIISIFLYTGLKEKNRNLVHPVLRTLLCYVYILDSENKSYRCLGLRTFWTLLTSSELVGTEVALGVTFDNTEHLR
jgi:hypothetical protein